MKVSVLIERDGKGRLHGFVAMRRGDGYLVKGADMLTSQVYRDVSAAQVECDRQVRKLFILVDHDEITYTLPAEDLKE